MRIRDRWFPITLTALLMAAPVGAKEEARSEDLTVVEMPEIVNEVYIPNQVWEQIANDEGAKVVRKANAMIYAPIAVELRERSPGVLIKPALRLVFPRGGGEIDLSRYVRGTRGAFSVKFDFAGFDDGDDFLISYVSKGRKRQLDGEIYGAGCSVFYDVKSYLQKQNAKDGLVVNVTRDRHVSALGGFFVFSYKKTRQTFVSVVSFQDSGHPELLCQEARQ